MNYVEFETGNDVYKLRLNTRNVIKLEKLLGGSPLKLFTGMSETEMPTVESMVNVLYCALLANQDKVTIDKAYNIFDEWLDNGHIIAEFLPIIIELYRSAGLIQKENGEKN